MNAILFYVTPTFRLTGSTINAIEYYMAVHEHNPKVKLYLLNGTIVFKSKLIGLMNERYEDAHLDIDGIECINIFLLPSKKFDTVLVLDYMTIAKTKGLINAKKILVISEKHTENPEFFYSKEFYNVVYYGEMPFHYKDHDYTMKCLFDRYKPLRNVKEGTYVNSPKNDDLIYDFDVNEFPCPTPYIFKSKTQPEENLFEKFTHYLYYHANKWFDPHPRLFLECAYYNKKIIYYNPYGVIDGSWFRYNDVKKNGVKGRTLDKNDEIIGQLI